MSKTRHSTDELKVIVTEAAPPADLEARWRKVADILFGPIIEALEEELAEAPAKLIPFPVKGKAEDRTTDRPVPSVRVIYGNCPKCLVRQITEDEYGHPRCLTCGWNGATTPGDQVEQLPEGTPLTYEASIEVKEGNRRRNKRHRERQSFFSPPEKKAISPHVLSDGKASRRGLKKS